MNTRTSLCIALLTTFAAVVPNMAFAKTCKPQAIGNSTGINKGFAELNARNDWKSNVGAMYGSNYNNLINAQNKTFVTTKIKVGKWDSTLYAEPCKLF